MWNRSVLLYLCLFVCLKRIGAAIEDCKNIGSSAYNLCILLNEEIDPCDDFYKFACGNYIHKENTNDFNRSMTRSDLEESVRQYLIFLLEVTPAHPNEITFERQLATNLYKSCRNRQWRGNESISELLQLMNAFGGWPVLKSNKWNETNWLGLRIAKDILREGFDISPILTMKYKSGSKELLLGLPTFAVTNYDPTTLQNGVYLQLMVDVAVIFGANRTIAENEMSQVLSFEIELMKNYDKHTQGIKLTIDEMKKRFPELMKYIQFTALATKTIDTKTKIVLYPDQYFINLENVLKDTPDLTIANYLMWRVVLEAADYLTEDFARFVSMGIRNVNRGYLFDSSIKYDVQKACLYYIKKLLPVVLDSTYIDAPIRLLKRKKEVVKKLAEKVRSELIKMIDESDWMDGYTKVLLMDSLKSVVFLIGNRDLNQDRRTLVHYNLSLSATNFFKNFLETRKYNKRHPSIQHETTWEITAGYKPEDNSIYIPAARLQWPYFELSNPSYLNYGAIGYLIGHELSHVIHVAMQKFDDTATDWFNSTETQYKEKVNCFKNQYTTLGKIDSIFLNPSITNQEDICDNLGVKAAYRAYNSELLDGNVLRIGLLNYTTRELFWISLAQSMCESIEPSFIPAVTSFAVHTILPYRIFGMIKNMDDFADDYNCSSNSRMYSKKYETCTLW